MIGQEARFPLNKFGIVTKPRQKLFGFCRDVKKRCLVIEFIGRGRGYYGLVI